MNVKGRPSKGARLDAAANAGALRKESRPQPESHGSAGTGTDRTDRKKVERNPGRPRAPLGALGRLDVLAAG
jgi:hypothetical protein